MLVAPITRKLKLTGAAVTLASVVSEAESVKDPGVALAVKVGALATPLLLEIAVATRLPPGKVPPGPLLGAVKVMVAPWTRLPAALRTVTDGAVAKAVLMFVDWLLPAAMAMLAGASSSWIVPVA